MGAAIVASGGAPLDLSDSSVISGLIDAAATLGGLSPAAALGSSTDAESDTTAASQVIAGVSQYIDSLAPSATPTYLEQFVQAEALSQGTLAQALAQTSAGNLSIADLTANYTGAALSAQIRAMGVASASPGVWITPTMLQHVGVGDSSTMNFTVGLVIDAPFSESVSVSYATADNTATVADGDYTTVTGTLTWNPGNITPQTIEILVAPGTTIAPDKIFLVTLSNPNGATVDLSTGVGIIQNSDYATTTSLTASTASTAYGQPVTFTATVANQDQADSPGAGVVEFSDGSTMLGTATLDANGVASLTVSNLVVGQNPITASYLGNQVPGANYQSSLSGSILETVGPLSQTISIGTISNKTYGYDPFFLQATASSDEPVSFAVVSGPATIEGDQLTITGAGTVVVEASQPGDSNYAAAPVVDQSFTVSPAELTYSLRSESMVYGGALPSLAGDFSGFVNGDNASNLSVEPTLFTVPADSGVGSYAIDASGIVDPNYTIIYVPGTLTITSAQLTVLPAEASAGYGAAYPTLAATLTGALSGDLATLESELSLTTAPAGSPVGSYDIDASGITDSNYTVNYATGTLAITPAPLTITALGLSAAYGAVPSLSTSYSGLVNGDTVASLTVLPILTTSPAGSPVGTYTINAAGAIDPNYTITYVPGTLTITPATLVITADDQTINYGQPLPTLTASYSGLAGGDTPFSLNMQPTLSLATPATDPGSYTVNVTGAADPNYVISYVTGTLTINPDETSLELTSSLPAPLGGQDAVYTATVIGALTGQPVTTGSVQFQVDGQDFGSLVALDANGQAAFDPGSLALGPHTITATFGGTTDFQPGSQTLDQTIYEYATTTQISESVSSATYGDTVTFTATVADLDPSAGTPTGSVQFEANDEPLGSPVPLDANGVASLSIATLDTGVQFVTASYVSPGSIFQAGAASTTITVNTASQTITFGPLAGVTYGAAPIALDTSASSGLPVVYTIISGPAKVSGSTVTITGVGTITIEADQPGDNNYLAAAPVDETLLVNPAVLTVMASPETKVYGNSDPTLTYTVSGLQYDDTAGFVLTGSLGRSAAGTLAGEQVGSYAITQGSLASNGDYTISFTGSLLSITPTTLTVSASPQTNVYGTNDPTLTYTTSGLVNTTVDGLAIDDTAASVLSGSLARATAGTLGGEQVGSYAISQGSLAPNSDYTISFAGNLLTITPATLTVTANPQTKVYGANDPTLTYTTSGLVNTIVDGLAIDDTVASVLTGSLARTAAGTLGGEQVGSYAIVQGSLASNNDYTISFTGSLLFITPATLTVTANPQTKVYGANDPTLTYTTSGLVNMTVDGLAIDDTAASVLSGSLARATAGTLGGEQVGSYAIFQGSLAAE